MINKTQHSDDTSLTISRVKSGRGYGFQDENGIKIKDKALLKRFRKLVIPPMWTEVKICKWEDGHIQAIGRDLKGRKQYIYHSVYEKQRQEAKFRKIIDFGTRLPNIRRTATEKIKIKKWVKPKILSLLIMIMDETGIRIGNQQYVKRNGTYGLTTLRRRHMDIDDDVLILEYKGKSNKSRHVEIEDKYLIKLIRKSAELPGYELFRYKDSEGNFNAVDSDDVNQYIRENMGDEFSSKDFRTWVATRIAVELYPEALKLKKDKPRAKFTNILLRLVADQLGNTPTVCRSYYVHPTIMQRIEDQSLPLYTDYEDSELDYQHSASEKLILDIVEI